jgi:OOP family OmpA-OmpF porin
VSGSRAAATAIAALVLVLGCPVVANAEGVNSLPAITDDEIKAAIFDIDATSSVFDIDAAASVFDIDVATSIKEMQTKKIEGSKTTITLNSDILFAFGKADLSPVAVSRIGDLAKQMPQGTAVKVYGYTDSIGTDADNLTLSQNRAQAVATAITASRSDLKLDVKGFGEANPVAGLSVHLTLTGFSLLVDQQREDC